MSEQLFSNVMINLGFMLLLIVSLGFIMLKFKKIKQSGLKSLKLIGTIPLGHKERLAVVEFYNKKILVGISAGQMQALSVHVEDMEKNKEIKFEQSMKEVLALKGIHVSK
jgi:flagellar biogenesis protein FliO